MSEHEINQVAVELAVLSLWDAGRDTAQIARALGIEEGEAAGLLARARERRQVPSCSRSAFEPLRRRKRAGELTVPRRILTLLRAS
jgi:DNA-binding transcriptional regulator LsrR (DeoR family)